LVFGVAVAVGVAGVEFDDAVVAFAFGVGQVGVDEVFDAGPPGADGGGEAFEFGDSRVGAPGVPGVFIAGL
jgi:hypothetical protein